jgi:hypothetical protein
VAGCQRQFLGFGIELREHGQHIVLGRDGAAEDLFFGFPVEVVAQRVDDPVLHWHGNAGHPSLQGEEFAFAQTQGHVQQCHPGLGKLRTEMVELHEQFVALERITTHGQPEHAERALACRGHHGLGQTQLAHVDIDNRPEVVGGHLKLLQADGGDEQDQQQLGDKPCQQRAPPGRWRGVMAHRRCGGGVWVKGEGAHAALFPRTQRERPASVDGLKFSG